MTTALVSPVRWMGGKHYGAAFILDAFPPRESYDCYCEPFMGGCHVIARKPPWKHREVVNDLNGDLVNFWLQLRDHAAELAARLESLPYSREVHYTYHQTLFDGTPLDPLERAAQWYYVLKSSFSAMLRPTSPVGWRNDLHDVNAYRSSLTLFAALSERFHRVVIDNRDFAQVITQEQGPRTLFYVDPPYIGAEDYYRTAGDFTLADHERLAAVLRTTPAMVVLSYYEHPLLAQWYPPDVWQRVHWQTVKHSQRTEATHEQVHEVLLYNFSPTLTTLPLWGQADQ